MVTSTVRVRSSPRAGLGLGLGLVVNQAAVFIDGILT